MKNFLITQNLYKINKTLQFSIEKNWFDLANYFKINLLPLGYYKFSKIYFDSLNFDGIIFSGGNDLYKFAKKKENLIRDNFENELLKYSIINNKKILAVCRGFQLVTNHFGAKIFKIKNHVKNKHKINIIQDKYINEKTLYTNSYHNYGFKYLPVDFEILAKSDDKIIEIAINRKYKILGLMFHPERKNFSQIQINHLIKNFFIK